MLYKLGQETARSGFRPSKFFSIDRVSSCTSTCPIGLPDLSAPVQVFRNETLDATHLAEFHQVEASARRRSAPMAWAAIELTAVAQGLVADYDLTLGDLIGVIQTFFKKIGGRGRCCSQPELPR
jgi:phenylalanyl-tRNA synthetase alpha chain